MRSVRLLSLWLLLAAIPAAALAQGVCSAPHFPPETSFIVVDDGNNLRQWGGADYAKAPILATLDALDEVGLLRREGRWAEVETRDGLRGWINAKCLAPRAAFLAQNADKGDSIISGCAEIRERTSFPLDPDGGGRQETLRLTCEPGVGCSLFTMNVVNAGGEVVFQGPSFGESPLIFCLCDAGTYWPDLVGDLDGDGRIELLAEYGPSDVSVSSFYLGRWNGRGFDTLKNQVALLEDPARPGTFVYAPYPEGEGMSEARWIMSFQGPDADGRDSRIRGSVYQYKGDPAKGSDLYYGEAVFAPFKDGFRLESWTKPFAKAY